MRLDYWNNPLVVSAFRVKYRRGSPGTTTSLFVLALATVGVLLNRYSNVPGMNWIQIYLLVLLGVQFTATAGYALTATATSMRAEVNNRTLDFQRIASLGPREILIGKLIGEPVGGYFMVLAAIPLVLWCAFMGAISLGALLLLYVQMITMSLMCGSAGLMQPLEPASKATSTGRSEGGGWGLVVFLFIVGTQSLFNARFLSQIPGFTVIVGLLTPIMSLRGLAEEGLWGPGLEIFEVQIPFLILGPLVQLAVAGLFFESMARRLINPLNPPLSKRRAYLVLAMLDALVAGALFSSGAAPSQALTCTAQFCLFHLLASFVLMFSVTPRRQGLMSWVWRFRNRVPWVRDSALGDRSENSLVLVIFVLIGLVNLSLLVWLPSTLAGGHVLVNQVAAAVTRPALMAILLMSLGVFYQLLVLVAPSGGKMVFYLIVGLMAGVPAALGSHYHLEWLQAFSPISHFIDWMSYSQHSLPPAPVIVLYSIVMLYSWRQLRQWVNSYIRIVDCKLAAMHADKPV